MFLPLTVQLNLYNVYKRVSSTLLQTQSDCPVKHDNAVDIDPRNMVSIIIIELK